MKGNEWAKIMPYKKPKLRSIRTIEKAFDYLREFAIHEVDISPFDSSSAPSRMRIQGKYPALYVDTHDQWKLYVYHTNNDGLTPVKVTYEKWRKAGKDDETHTYSAMIKRDYMVVIYELVKKLRKKRLAEIEKEKLKFESEEKYTKKYFKPIDIFIRQHNSGEIVYSPRWISIDELQVNTMEQKQVI